MKDNWKQIRTDILDNVKDTFENSNPQYLNVENAIEIFKNVLSFKTGIKKLDGLNESISESLNEIYHTKPGKINPLENLLNNIEAFLKKIIFIKTSVDYTNDNTKNLMWCLKELKLLQKNGINYPILDEANLISFKGKPNYLEHVCRTYISRNTFHNAPKLKIAEIYQISESALIVYIYSILLELPMLKASVGQVITTEKQLDVFKNYSIDVLSYNPTLKMIEGDFGLRMNTIDDFEIKVKAKAKKRKDEMDDYLKDTGAYTLTPIKLLPEIEGIISNNKYLLLHGIATSGKSTILKKLGKDFIEKYDSPYLFYFELSDIYNNKNNATPSLTDYLQNKFKNVTGVEFVFEKVTDKILILLDGLDEVSAKENRELIIKQIIELKKYNNIQVVLTSRTNEFISNDPNIDKYFDKFELLPLNINDIITIGSKILGTGSSYNNFVKVVKKNSLLKAFPKTPLTSILLAILFKDKLIDVKELPKNITELYKKFTDLFLNRWDKTKGISEQFEIQKKEFVLQTIAEYMHTKRIVSISEEELIQFIADLAKRKPIGGPQNPKEHLKNLCERTNILIKDQFSNTYKFFHLTIQEYLAAIKFDNKADDTLVNNFYDEWWLNPNIFYAGNRNEYPEVLNRISKLEIYPTDSEMKFNYISHCSKVLLAAHNLDNSIRNQVLKSMIKIFDEFSKEFILDLVSISEFKDENKAIDKKIIKIKNQTLLEIILTLRDIFLEFFQISDFQNELENIWNEILFSEENITLCDITYYCLSYCLSTKTMRAKYLEEFVITNKIAINSRWFKIVDVDINIKGLKNTRKNITLKIKQNTVKNKTYVQKQFKEKVSKHYESICGMK
jgi:hypothetical protein